MSAALATALCATVLFVICSWLFTVEAVRSKRLVAAKVRTSLDLYLQSVSTSLEKKAIYVGRYIITLSWYYSLHALLKLILQFLAGVYTVIEALLHRNRARARTIRTERKRAERSHLTALAEHKIETKLTDNQKKKRNDAALKGR